MARMIPQTPMPGEFNGSYGEEKVYEALKELPEEYIVFHSVYWQKRKINGAITWGESDFTIFNPKRGIIVVEVKSGGIRHDDNGWHQTNTLTHEENRMKDPLAQAERSKYTFVDLLADQEENFHTYWVESAVWFPSVEKVEKIGEMPPSYAPEIVLTEKDLHSARYSIERVFDYYGMDQKRIFNEDDEKNVVNILSPSFNVMASVSFQINEQNYMFNRMTQEQSYLLDYLEEQKVAAIQGGAGTGKTVLAIEKAKRASVTGKVLFLCFNKLLLESLKSANNDCNNIDFFNLPGLVCAKTGSIDAGGNNGISDYLNSVDPTQWGYKHIIIDEGQDFYEEHLEILSTIAELTQGCFYVFYDKNQLVQQRQSLDWVKNVECRLILTANCRNTRNIALTSNKSLGIENVKMRLDVVGTKPQFFINQSREQFVNNISKLIRKYTDSGIQRKDIVILTVKTDENSILSGLTSIGGYKYSRNLDSSNILFTSARKFKGLESDVVILIDVDEKTFMSEEERRVFYVGASRAKHFLDVFSLISDEEIPDFAEAITGTRNKNPKASIGSGLKVKIMNDL